METLNQLQDKIRLMTDRQILDEKFGGLSKATGHRKIFSHPEFPKPLPGFGKNLRDESEVDDFIRARMSEREG